jgi:hypothetical protein
LVLRIWSLPEGGSKGSSRQPGGGSSPVSMGTDPALWRSMAAFHCRSETLGRGHRANRRGSVRQMPPVSSPMTPPQFANDNERLWMSLVFYWSF